MSLVLARFGCLCDIVYHCNIDTVMGLDKQSNNPSSATTKGDVSGGQVFCDGSVCVVAV